MLPYPKDDGTPRTTCQLDPFDDVRFALLVSAIAEKTESAMPDTSVVQSTRFVRCGRVFRAEGWREASPRRGAVIDRTCGAGAGGFDVENYFGSIMPQTLRLTMNSCLVPDGQCESIVRLVEACNRWPSSPAGLPAGPMASALLGTLGLLPVDRLLRRLGIDYERWVDDFVIAAPSESVFLAVRQAVTELLGLNGQGLNPAKDWFNEPAGSKASFGDLEELGGDADDMPEPCAESFEEAMAARDSKRCRYILGGLRSRGDGSAVPIVATSDLAWVLVPRYAGDYLVSFCADLTDSHLEAMSARCSALPSEITAAGIAHAARVLSRRRVPGRLGGSLHDAADRISTGCYRGAAPFLYNAGSVSKEKPRVRCERSIETAGAVSDLLSARGLIAGLRFDTRSRVVDDGLRALTACRPDLAPTVAWIGA